MVRGRGLRGAACDSVCFTQSRAPARPPARLCSSGKIPQALLCGACVLARVSTLPGSE